MYGNDLHADQLLEAKRREGTLTLSKANRDNVESKPRDRQFSNRQKAPFVAKGHDAILKEIQDVKGAIVVQLISSPESIRGKLVARDKYTITVQLYSGIRRTLYKHAIESFESEQVAK